MGVIIAVDGGGSKTDAVALNRHGEVLGRARGTGTSPHLIGLDAAVSQIRELILGAAAGQRIERVHVYLSGLDLPIEIVEFAEGLAAAFPHGELGHLVVDNDLFALLRAGTAEPDAVAIVCGTGINCVGVRADGETVRFPALGMISGDWGGGFSIGEWGLWHAARSADGRGPRSTLEHTVPAALGLPDVSAVTEALHFGRIERTTLAALSPVVFAESDAGDPVAGSVVDRQAEEIVALATATLRRLGFLGSAVPVVLGGGVIASDNRRLLAGIASGIDAEDPAARIEIVREPPILGASLLALAAAGAGPDILGIARERVRLSLASPVG